MDNPGKYSDFEISPVLIGKYVGSVLKKNGKSRKDLQRDIGDSYSYDSINSLLTGEAKIVRADLLVKLCMAARIPMQDMILNAIDGEKEKHLDDIMRMFNSAPAALATPENDVRKTCPSIDYFISQLQQQQEHTMDRYRSIHEYYTAHINKQHEESLGIMRERHESSVTYLKERNASLAHLLDNRVAQVKRLRTWLMIVTGALALAIIALLILFIIESVTVVV